MVSMRRRLGVALDKLTRGAVAVIETTVDLFPGTLTAISNLIANSWAIIFVLTTGIVLVLLRNWFLANADSLAQQSSAFTFVINAVVVTLNAISVVVQSLFELVRGIESFASTGNPAFPEFKPQIIPLVNKTSFEKFCVNAPRQCANVDSPARIWQLTVTPYSSEALCGFYRGIYPVEWVFETLYPPARALNLLYPPYPPGAGPSSGEHFGNNSLL